VHYIPQQGMSLISVDKAISDQGFRIPPISRTSSGRQTTPAPSRS
jgi:hypothetical protein